MTNLILVSRKQFSFLLIFLVVSQLGLFSFQAKAGNDPQMINLNMKFKSNNKVIKTDLFMPYYQTAEIEKTLANKNILIAVSPRHGKNHNEVAIEMKFYKADESRAFARKVVIAKLGEESNISVNGMSVKVTPVL